MTTYTNAATITGNASTDHSACVTLGDTTHYPGSIDNLGYGYTDFVNSFTGVLTTSAYGGNGIGLSGTVSTNITNDGTIIVNGDGHADGIFVTGSFTGMIVNTGTISRTGGSNGDAISIGSGIGTISGSTGSLTGGIINSGILSNTGSGGIAVDFSAALSSCLLTNTGSITGAVMLSAHDDVVNIKGGSISGDIKAAATGHGTVNIDLGAGNVFTANGKIGDPAGYALANISVQSGELSIDADALNATTITMGAGALLDLTGTAASGASIDGSNHLLLKNSSGATAESFQLAGAAGLPLAAGPDGHGGTLISAGYTAAAAVSNAASLTGSITIVDSAAHISSYIDGIEGIAAAGKLTAITLTDSSNPILSISATELTSDVAVLKDTSGNFILSVSASAANLTIASLPGHATTVDFSGAASAYTLVSLGDGTDLTVTDSGTGRTSTDHLSGIAALQFSDFTEIVAAQPGSASAVTTGNVTELYAAVLAREPDVVGLTFYQNYLKANTGTSLLTFAEFFLSSSEYTSTHHYAQSAAGDQQFISDSYQNLLHRTASASEIAYYENNLLAPAVAGLTPGTTAYANAAFQAHAQMLVYFSASSEFLKDVQVTAANPASAQHWLLLI